MTNVTEAISLYRDTTPIKSTAKIHKAAIEAIRAARHPFEKARELVRQQVREPLEKRADKAIRELQGRRSVYRYDHAAVRQVYNEFHDLSLDPTTQVPIWKELLQASKEGPLEREYFMKRLTDIYIQTPAVTAEWIAAELQPSTAT